MVCLREKYDDSSNLGLSNLLFLWRCNFHFHYFFAQTFIALRDGTFQTDLLSWSGDGVVLELAIDSLDLGQCKPRNIWYCPKTNGNVAHVYFRLIQLAFLQVRIVLLREINSRIWQTSATKLQADNIYYINMILCYRWMNQKTIEWLKYIKKKYIPGRNYLDLCQITACWGHFSHFRDDCLNKMSDGKMSQFKDSTRF